MIDWVMKTQGVSFRHAVERLRHDSPLAADIVKQATVCKLSIPIAPDANEVALLVQMIGYYHDTLEQGRTWIRSRLMHERMKHDLIPSTQATLVIQSSSK